VLVCCSRAEVRDESMAVLDVPRLPEVTGPSVMGRTLADMFEAPENGRAALERMKEMYRDEIAPGK
jgi:hypothetical protein